MDLVNYKSYLVRNDYEDDTISSYMSNIRCLKNYHCLLNPNSLECFLEKKHNLGVKHGSINVYIKAVRSYGTFKNVKWMKSFKYWKDKEEPEIEILSDDEIVNLINCPRPEYFNEVQWYRWTMFLRIVSFSGMRGSNAARLTVDDIDFGTNNYLLEKTKTTPARIPIAPNIRESLQEYVKTCDKYLFPAVNDSSRPHIWRSAWIKHFQLRVKLTGIKRKVTLHCLRHSLITDLLENGASIVDVMKIANHKDIKSTMRYTHLTNKSQQNAIKKHSIVQKSLTSSQQFNQLVKEIQASGILEKDGISYELSRDKLVIEIISNK